MITLYGEESLLKPGEAKEIIAAAEAAAAAVGRRGNADICITTAAQIQSANLRHRGLDSETDVLSFPAAESGEAPGDGFFGDILINPVRARMQASEFGHSNEREFAFLTIHGLLHLFGYDHMIEKEELEMRHVQRVILERMGQTL